MTARREHRVQLLIMVLPASSRRRLQGESSDPEPSCHRLPRESFAVHASVRDGFVQERVDIFVRCAGDNAIAGGIKMKIVADKGREWKGYQLCGIMVSNKSWDNGLRTLKDLKWHRVGVTQIGSTFHYMLGNMLEKNGMTLDDVKVTPLGGVKSMMDTVASGQIETAFMVQPFCSVMEAKKIGHRMLWVSDYLSYQIAVIFFGDKMMKDRETSVPLMRAYIKGCRYYYDNCLTKKDGKLVKGPHFDEVMEIISKYTGREPKLIAMGLNYNDRNGSLYAEDIQRQIDWYYDHNLVSKRLDAKKIVDLSIWKQAMKDLGLKP